MNDEILKNKRLILITISVLSISFIAVNAETVYQSVYNTDIKTGYGYIYNGNIIADGNSNEVGVYIGSATSKIRWTDGSYLWEDGNSAIHFGNGYIGETMKIDKLGHVYINSLGNCYLVNVGGMIKCQSP